MLKKVSVLTSLACYPTGITRQAGFTGRFSIKLDKSLFRLRQRANKSI